MYIWINIYLSKQVQQHHRQLNDYQVCVNLRVDYWILKKKKTKNFNIFKYISTKHKIQ